MSSGGVGGAVAEVCVVGNTAWVPWAATVAVAGVAAMATADFRVRLVAAMEAAWVATGAVAWCAADWAAVELVRW